MKPFRTIIKLKKSSIDLHHEDKILCMGSCFAQHISEYLKQYKFKTLSNPFGILYNPISIIDGIELLKGGKPFEEKHLFQHKGVWNSPRHHSQFSDINKKITLERINQSIHAGHFFLQYAQKIIITFGTSFVFQNKSDGRVVANCHKLPASNFKRFRLSTREIFNYCRPVFLKLKDQNPQLEIILSVSPIRHLKDGFLENQKSKATLLLAIEELSLDLDFVHYFPAYEIMMDDLRDYRFYKSDMLHPNEQAVEYIWELFKKTYFSENTLRTLTDLKKLRQALLHRPLNPNSPDHKKFINQQLAFIDQLIIKYKHLDFGVEKRLLTQRLNE